MAFTPGGRRDPDTIAANVSIRCCFVASRAVAGNGCSAARTMYSETVVMTGRGAARGLYCFVFCRRAGTAFRFTALRSGRYCSRKRGRNTAA